MFACGLRERRSSGPGGDGAGGVVWLARPDRPGHAATSDPARPRRRGAGSVDVDAIPARLEAIARGQPAAARRARDPLHKAEHLEFNRRKKLGYHPNGMRFTAYDDTGAVLRERAYYSVGRFRHRRGRDRIVTGRDGLAACLSVHDATELLALTRSSGLPISGIMTRTRRRWVRRRRRCAPASVTCGR